MKIGIMQPYLFPYLGYFQLIHAVDRFVIYDDVNYIKGGWINRNNILGKTGAQRFTLQLFGASPNKLINEVEVGDNGNKILTTLAQAYGKAPYFSTVYPLLETCLTYPEKNLARFLAHSLQLICSYMGITTELLISSDIPKNNSLRGVEKVVSICKQLEGNTYINAIGGRELYDREYFRQHGLELFFLQMKSTVYPQFRGEFVPYLSIIDVMMFNSRNTLSLFLQDYMLV